MALQRSLLPQRRRRAREIALQILYSLDLCPDSNPESALELFDFEGEDQEVRSYAEGLVRGVWANRERIDSMLREYLTGWRPERLVAVDRVVVQLSLFEGVLDGKIPIAVSISEAVELAKRFGTEDSSRFVNGVLGRIVRAMDVGDRKNEHGPGPVSDGTDR